MAVRHHRVQRAASLVSAVATLMLLLATTASAREPADVSKTTPSQTAPSQTAPSQTIPSQRQEAQPDSFRLVQSSLQCPDEPGEVTFAFTAEEMARRLEDPTGLASDATRFQSLAVPADAWRVAESETEEVSLWVAEAGRYFYMIGAQPQVAFVAMIADITDTPDDQRDGLKERIAMLMTAIDPQTSDDDEQRAAERLEEVMDTGVTVGWLMNGTCWYIEHESELGGTEVVVLLATPPIEPGFMPEWPEENGPETPPEPYGPQGGGPAENGFF